MVEKQRHSLDEIKANGKYSLGMVAASLLLPKMVTSTPDGKVVTFKPDQNHIPYLRRSNEYPMQTILDRQKSTYGKIKSSDGKVILIAGTSSPYVVEGEHIILWALSGDNFKFQPNVNYISDEQGQKLFGTVANVIEIYQEKGLSYFIGMNSNDQEYQRQSVQSIRDGAHVHCVGLDEKDVQHFESIKPEDDARILNDPFALLTNKLLEKVVIPKVLMGGKGSKLVSGQITYEEYPYEYPKGTSLVLKDGVNTLRDPEFFPLVQNIHKTMEVEFEELARCFTDNKPDTFRTKVDDDIDTISFFRRQLPLSTDEITRRLDVYFEKHKELEGDNFIMNNLKRLAKIIKPASKIVQENSIGHDTEIGIPIVEAKTMNTKIFMEGLSYNLLIYPHPDTGELLLTFVPRVTTGGSPLDAIGIKKDQYSVSEEEFKQFVVEMDKRVDITVAGLMARDIDIKPGSAFKNVPESQPDM